MAFCIFCGAKKNNSNDICPKCGKPPYSEASSTATYTQQSFESASQQPRNVGQEKAQASETRSDTSQTADSDGQNSFDVLGFLKTAIQLEQRKYEQEHILANLESYYNSLAIPQTFGKPTEPTADKFYLNNDGMGPFFGIVFAISIIVILIFSRIEEPLFPGIVSFLIFAAVICGIGSVGLFIFLNLIPFFEDYKYRVDTYNAQCVETEIAIAEYEKRMATETVTKRNIGEQIQIARSALADTQNMIRNLHTLNVVYYKYRDIAALCSIFEYLESGRCTTLPDAYNKYDDEKFKNLLITKIDDVICHLDSIQDTQYMLYSAISEGNRNINSLVQSTYQMAASLDYQREQTSLALDYQRKQQADINTMKWLNIMK